MRFYDSLMLLTFFILWASGYATEEFKEFFALFSILTLGVLHGSNDMQLIKKMLIKNSHWLNILLKYVMASALFALLYFWSPVIMLSFFVLISSYHFGEQHWLEGVAKPTLIFRVFSLFYGFFIVLLLITINYEETKQVLREMVNVSINAVVLKVLLAGSGLTLLVLFFLTRKSLLFYKKQWWRELLILGVLAIIFARSSLLWGFAIYFVVWHSVPSIRSQILFSNGHILKWQYVKRYLKTSMPYWLLSVAGFVIVFYMFRDNYQALLALFIPFIAALTLPHAFVISSMFKKSNNTH